MVMTTKRLLDDDRETATSQTTRISWCPNRDLRSFNDSACTKQPETNTHNNAGNHDGAFETFRHEKKASASRSWGKWRIFQIIDHQSSIIIMVTESSRRMMAI
mmetsp:Transcript_27318/g.76642  ORF Transcript_27318/g.76642 Transcript_27318/m.76642 type:complete len:103 (-) Transcript_27318:409-717(-)